MNANQIIETTEVQRHNGTCQYGEPLLLMDAPHEVIEAVVDAVLEAMHGDFHHKPTTNTDDEGMVVIGGQRWVYSR